MTLTSRYFGEVDPGAVDDTGISATIESGENGSVEARLIIADPPRFRQEYLEQTDAALEYFGQLDGRARASMLAVLPDERSVPGHVYGLRKDIDPTRDLTPEEFTRSLRVASVVVAPDGGEEAPDRVSITYVSVANFVEQRFMAVVREGVGFVFVAAEEPPRSASSISYR